jgi:hypothetical protein
MRTTRACIRCGSALPPRHRKYCANCSPLASMLWKRARRREWRGTRYYLDPWLKRADGDENKARGLRNEYMRSYRAKNRPGTRQGQFSRPGMDEALPVGCSTFHH